LQPFPIENRTGAQTIELLSKRLQALGAVPSGQFLVDCDLFENQNFGQTRLVHVLHNSEYPASVFSILDTGTKTIPLITDGLFDLLMLKMTPTYTSKKQIKVESKGPRFELGDFLIKLGSVTMSQNFKGVLVEVDYRPCLVPMSCWELLKEFMQGFMGSHVPNTIPPYFTVMVPSGHNPTLTTPRMNEIYQPIDTIQQYLEHFNNYRKQVHNF
jgi:mediator of RNA polymerase II transcription subunit 20